LAHAGPEPHEGEARELNRDDQELKERLAVHPVAHVQDEVVLHELHREPRKQVDHRHEDERLVAEGDRQALQQLRPLLHLLFLRALAGERERDPVGDGDAHGPHCRRDHVPGAHVRELADQDGVEERRQDAAQDRKGHPVGRETRSLVVVPRQLGSQRGVRNIDGGVRGVEGQGDDQVVPELAGVAQRRDLPLQEEEQAERYGGEEQPRPAPSPA
jgi:hypothetical protein